MDHQPRIFISSVQKEFAAERRALADFIKGDPLLRRYFDVFVFEDLPATDRRADEVYLDEVDRCAVYVGLFGNEYGYEDADGISPTEREFQRATQKRKFRLVFVKGADDKAREPKMLALIRKASNQLIRRRFVGIPDLTAALYASLVEHLEQKGLLRTTPFDAAPAHRATLKDLATEKLRWFLGTARREREYVLPENTPALKALAHLHLLDRKHPNHAAILLFGNDPQRFLPTAETKCLHFHGTEIRKPIPSYQLFKGTIFDQVDHAVDFVMAKINRSVGTRAETVAAPVAYEIPKEVITEAVVNAVAHRDYTSNASVQVMLFADRLEVWNPGELPPGLTPELLRQPHASLPRNPLLADPLYLAHYIERAGTGTLDMIVRCREAGLAEPTFEQRGDEFVTTIWRDWLTDAAMAELGLNARQTLAISFLKTHGQITNLQFQQLANVPRRTSVRDLMTLVGIGVLERVGTGRGAHYVLSRNRAKNVPNVPSGGTAQALPERARNVPNAPRLERAAEGPTASSRTSKRKGK
jgi:predicted HTH transcriptional regulator